MQADRPPKQQALLEENADKPLIPGWAFALIALLVATALSAYFSADMRAVFTAAWAACF